MMLAAFSVSVGPTSGYRGLVVLAGRRLSAEAILSVPTFSVDWCLEPKLKEKRLERFAGRW